MLTSEELLKGLEERVILGEISEDLYRKLKTQLLSRRAQAASTGRPSPTSAPRADAGKTPATKRPAEKPCSHAPHTRSAGAADPARTDSKGPAIPEWWDFIQNGTPRGKPPPDRQADKKTKPSQSTCPPILPRPTMTLHEAAKKGNLAEIESHIEWKSDMNAKAAYGFTPLHWAVRNGHLEVVKLLLTCGPDVNARDRDGVKPLAFALTQSKLKIAELLVKYGADLGVVREGKESALTRAVRNDSGEVIRWLLERGVDVNEPEPKGFLPLYVACGSSHLDAARILLEYGADVNQPNLQGRTPLHQAVDEGREEVLRFLIEHGADVNLCDKYGSTPLMMATARPLIFAKLLLERGANVHARGSSYCEPGPTALHIAAYCGTVEMIKLLLAHGADVNARTGEGKTPRQCVPLYHRKEVAALLRCGWWQWLDGVLDWIRKHLG